MDVTTVAPGTVLGGRYELREPLARGGMGEVWRAEDAVLGRTVAVKVLLPSLSADPGFAERFQAEARAMAALSDPSIVEVYDYGQTDATSYLVMRLVEGESLHALLNRVGPLPPREAMRIVAQTAHALQQAHRRGIVHRDVKPSNLLIRPDGQLVLTDFGIASSATGNRAAGTGELIGTAAYLAPEQIAGDQVAPAADIYALGVVAYECLTATRPFVGDGPTVVAPSVARGQPRPLPESVPPNVRDVVLRALATDPLDRWPSAHAMAAAATRAARGLPDSPWVGIAPVRRAAARPARTAALASVVAGPRRRGPRVWLLPVVAGAAMLLAAFGIVLSNADTPARLPVPPATTVPGNGVSPQQTPANPPQNATTGHGDDHSGHGGGDGSGGDGGHGRG